MTTPLLDPTALDPSPSFCIKLSNNDFTSQIILESQAAWSAQASEGKGRLGGEGGGGGREDT